MHTSEETRNLQHQFQHLHLKREKESEHHSSKILHQYQHYQIDPKMILEMINFVNHPNDTQEENHYLQAEHEQHHEHLATRNHSRQSHNYHHTFRNTHISSHEPVSHFNTFIPQNHNFSEQHHKNQQKQLDHLNNHSLSHHHFEHEKKIDDQFKQQIIEHKQHLNELKQKKKEQQRKIQQQKLHQQQKQRLQKLRQQTRQFLQAKKQKDKQILKFKKQLQHLKQTKQKQVVKQKQRQLIHDIEELKKNQQMYYEAVMQQKQKLARQMDQRNEQNRQKQQQSRLLDQKRKALFNSTAYQLQMRERKLRQQQDRKKIQEIRNFLMRRNSYQQKLKSLQQQLKNKQKAKPIKTKSSIQVKSQQRRLNAKSLSAAQIYRMGQQYMQQVHSNINPFLIQQSKFIDRDYKSVRQSSRTEYKDYLKESKIRRQNIFKSTGKLSVNPQIRQLRNLIVKQQNSPQKLLKAKLLTQRFDKKIIVKKQSTKLKADSIAAKLKIIQEFI